MAATVPQPPPMVLHPQAGSDKFVPSTSRHSSKSCSLDSSLSGRRSPSSPTASTHVGSPTTSSRPEIPSLDSHRALGTTSSEKSSFSSVSSGASSPASLTYSPAVRSALRDSYQSSTGSHRSITASPHSPSSKIPKDLEKQPLPARSSKQSAGGRTRTGTAQQPVSSYASPEGEDSSEDSNVEDKSLRILLYLSFPNCIVSFIILMYTFLALVATILLQPLRLCTSSGSFRQQVIGFLVPALKIQLAFIYSASSAEDFSAPMLVMVNLLSPLISLGVAGAAWVAAAFWFFNAILGDPDGSDKPKGYNDGRASVIGVRSWWETWLRRPLR